MVRGAWEGWGLGLFGRYCFRPLRVSFCLTRNPVFSLRVVEGAFTTSIDAESSVWKTTSTMAKFIMFFQTLVIGFLTFWIYEEYLNNTYLQAYVNGVFDADGWAFASVAVIV